MIKAYSPFLKIFLVAVFLSAFTFSATNAQVVNSNTEDIIIHIEHFNFEKQLNDLNQTIYNFKGTKLIGYCKSLDVLMFRINRNVQSDDTKMFEALKTAGYLFQVKENASIEKVQAACTDRTENQIHHQE